MNDELKREIIEDVKKSNHVKPFRNFSKSVLKRLLYDYPYVEFSELYYDYEDEETGKINHFFNNWIEPYEYGIWGYDYCSIKQDLKSKLKRDLFTLKDYRNRVFYKTENNEYVLVFMMRDVYDYDIIAGFHKNEYR